MQYAVLPRMGVAYYSILSRQTRSINGDPRCVELLITEETRDLRTVIIRKYD